MNGFTFWKAPIYSGLAMKKFESRSGDTMFLLRKVAYTFIPLTEKARLIVSNLPAGKREDFFRRVIKLTNTPNQDVIITAFADCNLKVVEPPLKSS